MENNIPKIEKKNPIKEIAPPKKELQKSNTVYVRSSAEKLEVAEKNSTSEHNLSANKPTGSKTVSSTTSTKKETVVEKDKKKKKFFPNFKGKKKKAILKGQVALEGN